MAVTSGSRHAARAATSSSSFGPTENDRALALVQLTRSGHGPQCGENLATPEVERRAVWPAGQVTVRPAWSTWKSSRRRPPGTAGCEGIGLMTRRWRRSNKAVLVAPEP